MRPHIHELIKRLAHLCEPPIVEVGSYQCEESQKDINDLRPLFPSKQFTGTDMRPGPGVDRILDITFPVGYSRDSERPKTILMLDTIEHIEYPHTACTHCCSWMAWNSIFIMTGAFYFKIHDYPHDYWRFTPAAFNSLLKPFDASLTYQVGQPLFPHTILGIGLNGNTRSHAAEIDQIVKVWISENQ